VCRELSVPAIVVVLVVEMKRGGSAVIRKVGSCTVDVAKCSWAFESNLQREGRGEIASERRVSILWEQSIIDTMSNHDTYCTLEPGQSHKKAQEEQQAAKKELELLES
jgi:hypothetical protein